MTNPSGKRGKPTTSFYNGEAKLKILDEVDISLEVIYFLASGLILLVLGVVLFLVARETLPYYQDGVYGLLLIIFGLQLQIIGKKPIRSVERSWPVLIPGIIITAIGFITCFVPEILSDIPKILVIVIFGVGGILLFLQNFVAKGRFPPGKTSGDGVLSALTLSCATVYIVMILVALLVAMQMYLPGVLPTELLAGISLLFGMVLIYIAIILRKLYPHFPESAISANTHCIPLDIVMGMQYGIFMLVSGCLLVPVYGGLLPWSSSAHMGTLVVLLGIQALVTGHMMTLTFKRSGIVILAGMVYIGVGSFAIIVPDILVKQLAFFVAVFNIFGGLYLTYSLICNLTRPKQNTDLPAPEPEGKDLHLLLLLLVLAFLTAILMILIGIAMLIIDHIPGIALAIFLAGFGLTLFALFYVRSVAEKKHLL